MCMRFERGNVWGFTCNVDVLDDVQDVVFVDFAIFLSIKDVVDGDLLVV